MAQGFQEDKLATDIKALGCTDTPTFLVAEPTVVSLRRLLSFRRASSASRSVGMAPIVIVEGAKHGLDFLVLSGFHKQDALIMAVGASDPTAVRVMCENGASPWTPDEGGISVRLLARMNGDEEAPRVLDEFSDPALYGVKREAPVVSSFRSYLPWSMDAVASQRRNLPS